MQRLLSIGVLGACFAGCSAHGRAGGGPGDAGCGTVFRIDNRGPEAVDVFLHRGVVVRLGTVPAWRTVYFTGLAVDAPGARTRLIARPVSGGRAVVTEELLLHADDRVRWTITQPFKLSSITAVVEPTGPTRSVAPCAA